MSSKPFSDGSIPGLEELFDYRLMEAIFNRRCRRFGLGMEIDEGPLSLSDNPAQTRIKPEKVF
ncbi:MAG: hypothetical protein H5U02_13755 [Clostridia bacterium]|nr:hypothetical protein [Clostridia bacterium]